MRGGARRSHSVLRRGGERGERRRAGAHCGGACAPASTRSTASPPASGVPKRAAERVRPRPGRLVLVVDRILVRHRHARLEGAEPRDASPSARCSARRRHRCRGPASRTTTRRPSAGRASCQTRRGPAARGRGRASRAGWAARAAVGSRRSHRVPLREPRGARRVVRAGPRAQRAADARVPRHRRRL